MERIKFEEGSRRNILFYHTQGQPKAIVQVLHGFGEFADCYEELAHLFTAGGFACIVHDQHGFGEEAFFEPAKRGVVKRYSHFMDDMDTVRSLAERRYPDVPVVLYGNSMGGNIALSYLLDRRQDAYKAAVLEAPWLRLHKPLSGAQMSLARFVGMLGKGYTIMNNRLDSSSLGYGAGSLQAVHNSEYFHGRISYRLVATISMAGEAAIRNAARIHVPLLILSAENEMVVSNEAIAQFMQNAGENARHENIAGGYHLMHIANAEIVSVVAERAIAFINEHI